MSLDSIFTNVLTSTVDSIQIGPFIFCMVSALILGFFIALCYSFKTKYTKGFIITLATLPTVVCMVIMMVNGNIGTGVAVAGAFSLVRFRSVPGTAKEIAAIFLTMAAGLACGMGYVGFAFIFTVVIALISAVLSLSNFGEIKATQRNLTVTMPEDLDYSGIFDDLFIEYTKEYQLIKIKTINMGSLFKITYAINLKSEDKEKELIDGIRCRNGNLEIVSAKAGNFDGEL